MIIIQVEEQIHYGKTWKELVKKMYQSSFDTAINKANFMFNVQERISQLYDKHVSTENYEQFILDLDEIGLIKLFRCRECANYNQRPLYCLKHHKINPDKPECPDIEIKGITLQTGGTK